MKRPIIDSNKSYTFRNYFEMNPPIRELLAYFGYSLQVQICTLPSSSTNLTYFTGLKERLETHLKVVQLSSEVARREVLVGPILFEVAAFLQATVDIEYPLYVNEQLKGKIDYYLQRSSKLLIIEAKNDDLGRGFTQLAVELIAIDKLLDEDAKPLYGIISIGNAWQFGILNRQTKIITQDINLYRVPADIEELLQILIAILEGDEVKT
jgi:hypothetical protein